MLDAETGHNSAKISNVEQRRFQARNEVARRRLHILKANDPADIARSIPEELETIAHALTAKNLAQLLQVSEVTIYKLAKANKLPSFRIGTAVRFDPRAVALWLRQG
jgi:excisionase family DNA binding protein